MVSHKDYCFILKWNVKDEDKSTIGIFSSPTTKTSLKYTLIIILHLQLTLILIFTLILPDKYSYPIIHRPKRIFHSDNLQLTIYNKIPPLKIYTKIFQLILHH